MADAADQTITIAEKLLALLDTGRYTATYKFATLIALIDVCVESVDAAGAPPSHISAKAVGRRVFELLWQHSLPYTTAERTVRLRHSTLKNDLVSAITDVRAQLAPLRSGMTLDQARRLDADAVAELERKVITTVIRMPLPKLQRYGSGSGELDCFLYDFGWPDEVPEGRIWKTAFDDTLHMKPGVGSALIRLAGVLRPVIQQRWAAFVADRSRNDVEIAFLDEFLFGANRVSLDRVRAPLLDLQSGRCFYCERSVTSTSADVDHFVPWVRHPDNGIDNLVVAHKPCNNNKRDALAAVDHLERWLARTGLGDLGIEWPSDRGRTLSAARANYLWLPEGARLWRAVDSYVAADRVALQAAFVSLAS